MSDLTIGKLRFPRPDYVPELTPQEVSLIKAMYKSDPRALNIICTKLCGINEPGWIPGDTEGTLVMQGRQFVGLLIKQTVEANEGQRKRLKQKLDNPKGDEDE